jgi:tryptophan 7-halogenase
MTSSTTEVINRIVIVGGGSAGWLTAGLIASEYAAGGSQPGVSVTLVESPDVKTIGVGEGTWPTMRGTLRKIGIPEAEFLSECGAAFKQGTRFVGWVTGATTTPITIPSRRRRATRGSISCRIGSRHETRSASSTR